MDPPSNTVFFGDEPVVFDYALTGHLGTLIGYNGAHSTGVEGNVRAHLRKQWGIPKETP